MNARDNTPLRTLIAAHLDEAGECTALAIAKAVGKGDVPSVVVKELNDMPDEISVRDDDGGRIAILANLKGRLGMQGRRDTSEVEANARLIAAAPDLLEALQELCEIVEDAIEQKSAKDLDSFTLQPARAAIAKATGEQP